MIRSALVAVAAIASALAWSGPKAHARAARGGRPKRTWRAMRRSTRTLSCGARNHVEDNRGAAPAEAPAAGPASSPEPGEHVQQELIAA